MRRSKGVVAGFATVGCLIGAAPALAAERFASATGVDSGTCQNTAGNPPCNITRAINLAPNGDTVTVLADGEHVATAELNPAGNDVIIRGAPGQPRPTIRSTEATMMSLGGGAEQIRDIRLLHEPAGAASALNAGATNLVERVVVDGGGAAACSLTGNAVIRDSHCRMMSTSPARHGLLVLSPANVTARNVTAVATVSNSSGVRVVATGGNDAVLDGRNVIAQAGGATDVQVNGQGAGSDASATFTHSNFDTLATLPQTGGTATGTAPGSGTNQTASPIFVDATTGNLHQAASSPTIDAGNASASMLGATDIDGEPRIQGGAPDIGADEFDQIAPTVTITNGPAEGETVASSSATFEFASDDPTATFSCAVDGAGLGPCSGGSTHTAAGLVDGSHSFSVRATDPSGNFSTAARGFAVALPPGDTPDTDPPETTITKRPPNKTEKERAKFKFTADEAGATFECKLDKKRYKPCRSPRRYKNLDDGRHKFVVRATDPAGNTDPTAAKDKWKVLD